MESQSAVLLRRLNLLDEENAGIVLEFDDQTKGVPS